MVIELDGRPGQHRKHEWRYSGPEGGHANWLFASASSPDGAAIEIFLNDELVEKVYLSVPHSWWPPTQRFGKDSFGEDDVLLVRALRGRVAFRIDLDEHRPEV